MTERELELWVLYLGPVWKKGMEAMKAALAAWYRAMQEEGLIAKGPNSMAAFLAEGLHPCESGGS